jgi:hypothetical protein
MSTKYLSISIFLFSLLLINSYSPHSSEASLLSTDITFHANKTLVAPNESISFFIGLSSNNQWQAGSITLRDITINTEKTYNVAAELTIVTDFLINNPEGKHIIEASDGSLITTLNVVVRDPANQGPETDSISVLSDNPAPNVDASFILTATLDVTNYDFLPFDGSENIYVKTNGLINSPILASHWFPLGVIAFPFTVNISVFVPLWHPIGLYNFEIGFTGDTNLQITATTIPVFLTTNDFVLNLTPDSTDIDRSSLTSTNQLSLDLSLGGAEISLNNLYYNVSLITSNGSMPMSDPFLIGNRQRTVIFDVSSQIPLGDALIHVDILDSMDTVMFSEETPVVIYDRVGLVLNPNNPQVRAGENINFLVLTALTDRPNTAVETNIVVKNETQTIGSGTTVSGEWNFNYQIPSWLTQGYYSLIWELTPIGVNSTLIRNNTIIKQYVVSLPTEFYVSNFPSQIFRNNYLDFNVQLLSQGYPLIGDVGTFDLYEKSNLSIIESYQANVSQNIHLLVDKDLSKGIYGLQVRYDSNTAYE